MTRSRIACRWCGDGPVKALGLCKRHYQQDWDERNRERRRTTWRASARRRRAKMHPDFERIDSAITQLEGILREMRRIRRRVAT